MLSLLTLGLLTYKNDKFGVKQRFEDFLANKFRGDMKAFLAERKSLAQTQSTHILLAG